MGLFSKILIGVVCLFAFYGLSIVLGHLLILRAARRAGASLTYGQLLAMRRRRTNPRQVVAMLTEAGIRGLDVSIEQIEQHETHGGRTLQVIEALRLAGTRKLGISWQDLCRRDLAGEDVLEFVRQRVAEHDKISEAKGGKL